MESIKEIYRIGNGPSSSHTIGPKNAAIVFLKRTPNANSYK
ncbi:MAG TPA: serine dehydratase, partial [Bacteroidales bacterium]|nr:serine dehydratase [Bacteroidales bacterium]